MLLKSPSTPDIFPFQEDGNGSGGRSSDKDGEIRFWGFYTVCENLKELFGASKDKRSWEEIFMSLYEVCAAAKEKVEADHESAADDDDGDDDHDDEEADLERRVGVMDD